MKTNYEKVLEFHKRYGCHIELTPTIPGDRECALRKTIVQEEVDELMEAIDNKDIVEVADALADILYLVYGTAISFGLDMQIIFDEVHRSNMTKTPGKYREDGKVLKGPDFFPPDIKSLLVDMRINLEE